MILHILPITYIFLSQTLYELDLFLEHMYLKHYFGSDCRGRYL